MLYQEIHSEIHLNIWAFLPNLQCLVYTQLFRMLLKIFLNETGLPVKSHWKNRQRVSGSSTINQI